MALGWTWWVCAIRTIYICLWRSISSISAKPFTKLSKGLEQ